MSCQWVPRLTRRQSINVNTSSMKMSEYDEKDGEATSKNLFKKRKFTMDVCSIRYNDNNICTILLNLKFDIPTGQSLS